MSKRMREEPIEIILSKCHLNEFDLDELNFDQFNLDDPDEYDELEKAVNKEIHIKSCVKRYHRYLDGITDWLEFKFIQEDIKMFLKNADKQIASKELARKIDLALFILATEVRAKEEIDQNPKIKKNKKI